MKNFLLLLLVMISSVVLAQDKESATAFINASDAFEAGEFAKSLEGFEELLKTETKNPTLYYNAGKAAEASEEIGLAVYYYRKALQLNPSLEVARNNLMLIQPEINQVDRNTTSYIFSQAFISSSSLLWLAVFQLVMIAFFLLLYRLSKSQQKGSDKLGGNIVLILGCVVALIFAGIIFLHDAMRNENIDAIVMNQTVMRQGPAEKYFEVMNLKQGTAISLLNSPEDGWVRGQLMDGTVAFVKVNDLRAL